jgi:hypothetical protein
MRTRLTGIILTDRSLEILDKYLDEHYLAPSFGAEYVQPFRIPDDDAGDDG